MKIPIYTTRNLDQSPTNKTTAWREFHISRQARDQYHFDQSIFKTDGNVILADFHAAHLFAKKVNDKRDLLNFPEQAVKASHINALGLIDEMIHFLIEHYREEISPMLLKEAVQHLYVIFQREDMDKLFLHFIDHFPPVSVYRGEVTAGEYLNGVTEDVTHRELLVEELIVLWLQNQNQAFQQFNEFFDDETLKKHTVYKKWVEAMHEFFRTQPDPMTGHETLLDLLLEPARKHPYSLVEQLEFFRNFIINIEKIWRKYGQARRRALEAEIHKKYYYRPLSAIDFIREEADRFPFLGAKGPTQVQSYWGMEVEPEQYSRDLDWMPRVVMMAKNAFVWLDQLSKQYLRPIHRLDNIPDEELDRLAHYGFTALWLIGLWERSHASKRIKQLCGNPDAVASAYSLFDYNIAHDLGGEDAFQNLKQRAAQRGIRLAGDMVPNHMGIDSRWVYEHPDWFISVDQPPFLAYEYKGPNLSEDHNCEIYIEDHYYNRTDAAVVFKHVDHRSGRVRYIYHGNDGTSMPWNDTAQLNYLMPEVREAVIQTILHVARKTSVIRFDAAMTLAKKHYQRLWFPQPGSGGDIPSRAQFGLTKEHFDQLMPVEFWREVVDRVAAEAPDTLLLAEAFWLMEGYFVRTLGMHRVYNSAFMNMLRNEENAKYRETIKNVLSFDPEILKRHVNFMNNPDEDTAVSQFGKGDKYFGICILMSTMPGLPMFGHGQIEGYTEKYGMEYRRAYYDEYPDGYLVHRHEREIFPILKKRYIFANVENFYLYDFLSVNGHVDENVFAYSNQHEAEKALVVYHNIFGTTRGWVRMSVSYLQKNAGNNDERIFAQKSLGQALGLKGGSHSFCILREITANLEYIYRTDQILADGLYVELEAYNYRVFIDVREIEDNEFGHYAELTEYLGGRGVPSIEDAFTELTLRPIHPPFRSLIAKERVAQYLDHVMPTEPDVEKIDYKKYFEVDMTNFLNVLNQFTNSSGDSPAIAAALTQTLRDLESLSTVLASIDGKDRRLAQHLRTSLLERLMNDRISWVSFFMWNVVRALGQVTGRDDYEGYSRSWIDEWTLSKLIEGELHDMGFSGEEVQQAAQTIKYFTSQQRCLEILAVDEEVGVFEEQAVKLMRHLLKQSETQKFLQTNRYQDILWFNRESFIRLLEGLFVVAYLHIKQSSTEAKEADRRLMKYVRLIRKMRKAMIKSNYQVDRLLAYL